MQLTPPTADGAHTSASTTHRASNLASFRTIASSAFVPLEVSSESTGEFKAKLSTINADDIIYTEVTAHPHLVKRTAESIDSGGAGFYKLSLLLSGSGILVQDGKELVMQAGELSFYDTSRPYSLLFGENFRNLIMMFPKDKLEFPTAYTEELAAVSLSQEQPQLTPILSAMLGEFPSRLAPLEERVRGRVAHTSMDLLSTIVSSVLDSQPEQRDPHQLLLRKIYAHIDANLASPDLTPGSIAAAHFISTRHLHALFSEADTTVSTWIRERRLEHCRADLLDPVLADRTVMSLASRWGFTDASHFSRIFKAAYGVSPSALRQVGVRV